MTRHRWPDSGVPLRRPELTMHFTMNPGFPEEYRCTGCDEVTTIFRHHKARPRSAGHRKHMWCLKCKRIVAHHKVAA